MTARAFCNEVHGMLVALHGADKVTELLYPPSIEEQRELRRVELLALGGEVG